MRREPEFVASGYEVNRRVVGIQSDACYFDDPDPSSQNQTRSPYPTRQAPTT